MGDRIADPMEMRTMLGTAALILGTWFFAAVLPLMIAGFTAKPDPWVWVAMGILFSYVGFTGIRAWRRGWKSRFILRIVVPLTLFALSAAATMMFSLARA